MATHLNKTWLWLHAPCGSWPTSWKVGRLRLSVATHDGMIEVYANGPMREFESMGIYAYIFVSGKNKGDQDTVTSIMEHISNAAQERLDPALNYGSR